MKHFLLLLVLCCSIFSGEYDAIFRSFQSNAEYIRPFTTILGTMTNGGWYTSAQIGREFQFRFSIPVSITRIGDGDRYFSGTYNDEAVSIVASRGGNTFGAPSAQTYKAPTMLGSLRAPEDVNRYYVGMDGNILNSNGTPYSTKYLISDGIAGLNDLKIIPFATIQMDFSFMFTAIHLRYTGAPLGEYGKMHFPGIGLQHNLNSFLPIPVVAVSIADNITVHYMRLSPGDNIQGTLEVDGFSNYLAVLATYPLKFADVTLDAGWEYAKDSFAGSMNIVRYNGTLEPINPDLTLKGRNTIRAGITFAFKTGPYSGSVSHSFGADMHTSANLLAFSVPSNKTQK